jgi:thioredoxin 1
MREITTQELKELQSQGKKILVDLKARWCGPCRTLIPRLDEMSKQYENVEFVAVDVDDNKEGCVELGIRSVPTVMIFDGDKLVDRSSGVNDDSYYKNILNNL